MRGIGTIFSSLLIGFVGSACLGETAPAAGDALGDAGLERDATSPLDDASAAHDEGLPDVGPARDAGRDAGRIDASAAPAPLLDLWNGSAHFVVDQKPAPVPGAPGHREAFAVERVDRGANTLFLYHRCFNNPAGKLALDICLDESTDGGKTFAVSHGVVVHQTLGYFAVAPSVARIGTTWTMVWEEGGSSSGTYWATSPDGITWTSHGALFPGNVYNATPGLYAFQQVIYVFSAQRIGGGNQLGIAFHSGPSMGSLTQYGGGFVLSPASLPGWDHGSLSMPRIVFQGGYHWMFYEAGSVNLNCGTTAEPNDYGWGVARSTSLTTWQTYPRNPIVQGVDGESCGYDMPQPLLRASGEMLVYHTTDDVGSVQRDRLVQGSACTPNQLAAGYRERNFVCVPTCGGAGGTSCSHTKACAAAGETKLATAANPGLSADCVSCCK